MQTLRVWMNFDSLDLRMFLNAENRRILSIADFMPSTVSKRTFSTCQVCQDMRHGHQMTTNSVKIRISIAAASHSVHIRFSVSAQGPRPFPLSCFFPTSGHFPFHLGGMDQASVSKTQDEAWINLLTAEPSFKQDLGSWASL